MSTETQAKPEWADGRVFRIGDSRYGDEGAWCEDIGEAGFVEVGEAAKMLRRRHTGFFLDDVFQDETAVGVVLEKAEGIDVRYHAAIRDPYNGYPRFLVSADTYTEPNEAAHSADHMAERYAEAERNYNAAGNAAHAAADELHALRELREDIGVYEAGGFDSGPVYEAAKDEERRLARRVSNTVEQNRWREPSVFDEQFRMEFGADWNEVEHEVTETA